MRPCHTHTDTHIQEQIPKKGTQEAKQYFQIEKMHKSIISMLILIEILKLENLFVNIMDMTNNLYDIEMSIAPHVWHYLVFKIKINNR